jgi:hypothetical protein
MNWDKVNREAKYGRNNKPLVRGGLKGGVSERMPRAPEEDWETWYARQKAQELERVAEWKRQAKNDAREEARQSAEYRAQLDKLEKAREQRRKGRVIRWGPKLGGLLNGFWKVIGD